MKRVYQSSSSMPKLFLACLEGDAVVAKRFATPSNVNEKFSVSALFMACATGNYDLAKVLIDAGANVSEEPDLLFQVFQSSCDAETKCKLVDLLLSSGADVNRKWNNKTPLEVAVSSSGCAETIKFLIERGADIYDSKGICFLYGPLCDACDEGDFALIEALLQADVKEAHRLDLVNNGLKYVIRISDNDDEVTERMIKLLLAKGADINFDDEDYKALHVACGCYDDTIGFWNRPNPKLVRVLCENGARVNAVVEDGLTAMHILCSYNDVYDNKQGEELSRFYSDVIECIKILLQHGAKTDICDKFGNTPLHLACDQCKLEGPQVARFLCENGANVNAADGDGRTALHILCAAFAHWNHQHRARYDPQIIEFVKIFLDNGAEVNISDDNGDEPFILAVMTGKHEVVDLLLEHQKEHLPEYNEESGNDEESEDGKEAENDDESKKDEESENDEEQEPEEDD